MYVKGYELQAIRELALATGGRGFIDWADSLGYLIPDAAPSYSLVGLSTYVRRLHEEWLEVKELGEENG